MTLPSVSLILLISFPLTRLIQLHHAKAEANLQKWADSRQYQILKKQPKLFRRGRSFWATSNNQVIYRITIQDTQGNIREAWVRCGGFFTGSLPSKVDVLWDSPALQPVETYYIDSEPRCEFAGAMPDGKHQAQKADAERSWWDV